MNWATTLLILKVIGAAAVILVALWQLVHFTLQIRLSRRTKRLQRELEMDQASPQFTVDEVKRHVATYVQPDCAQTDPASEFDISAVVDVRERIFAAMDRAVVDSAQRRHQLVLADSGMGKTSFCLNYLEHLRRERKQEAVFISLAQSDALAKLEAVPRKSRTVALLDALDEDPAAIREGAKRLYEVLEAASDFRSVIVTCRSQFFPTDLAIPTETGVSILTPRMAGQNASYRLYRLYLSAFDDGQVRQFIRTHFPLMNPLAFGRRRKAYELVANVRELAARPMLLELLPLLVKDGTAGREIFELSQYMVDKWFEREASWIPEDRLRAVSVEMAVEVHTRHVRGLGDRVTVAQLDEIASRVSEEPGAWDHLTTRSLLNRDSVGNLKFAHRSIMEFLFVVAALEGDERCLRVRWTDFMKEVLISWGYTTVGRENLHVAERLLSSDLSRTALLPLSEPPVRPSTSNVPDFAMAADRRSAGTGSHRSANGLWRRNSFSVTESEGMARVVDVEFNLEWRFQVRARWAKDGLIDEYRRTVGETLHVFNAGAEFRLPSFAEFVTLAEGLAAKERDDLLPDGEIYLLGDMLGDRRHVAVRLGIGLGTQEASLLIDRERPLSSTGRKASTFEFGIHSGAEAFRLLRVVGIGVRSGISEE